MIPPTPEQLATKYDGATLAHKLHDAYADLRAMCAAADALAFHAGPAQIEAAAAALEQGAFSAWDAADARQAAADLRALVRAYHAEDPIYR